MKLCSNTLIHIEIHILNAYTQNWSFNIKILILLKIVVEIVDLYNVYTLSCRCTERSIENSLYIRIYALYLKNKYDVYIRVSMYSVVCNKISWFAGVVKIVDWHIYIYIYYLYKRFEINKWRQVSSYYLDN